MRVKKKIKKNKKIISSNAVPLISFCYVRDKISVYFNFIAVPFLQFLTNIRPNSDSDSLNTCL